MARYFFIPEDAIISLPEHIRVYPDEGVYVAHNVVRGWAYINQSRGRVVKIEIAKIIDRPEQRNVITAWDGSWVDSLLEESTGGGGSSGAVRVAAGGFYGLYEPEVLISFPAADTWVELNSTRITMQPYNAAGTNNCSYDVINNRLRLDWVAPVPTAASWMEGIAVLTTAATSNNQTYAIAWGVDGIVEPDFQVRFIRENPNDSETITLTGHRQVSNMTELSLFIKNIGDVNPIAISNVNFRFFGGNNV